MKIEQVEPQFAREVETPLKAALKQLGYSIPENSRLRVSFLSEDGRKKRSNASADTWNPGSGRMQFWLEAIRGETTASSFEEPQEKRVTTLAPTAPPIEAGSSGLLPAEAELLKALDRAESTPGWSFVSLKKFRDEILPLENIAAIQSDVDRQNLIRIAIDKKFILKKPVPNPKSPQFPVTSIRLNRLMPQVQTLLGKPKTDLGFHPIHIKGEPLSATILRERR